MIDQIIKHGQEQGPSHVSLLQRMALPIFLFSASLVAFLLLSKLFVLPALTSMKLPGQTLSPEEVAPERQKLEAQLEKLEQKRSDQLFGGDTLHSLLRERKETDAAIGVVIDSITRIARESVPLPGVIMIENMAIDAEKRTVTLRGDVSGVGPSSMTILAGFADALEELDSAELIKTSPFTRLQSEDGSFHSPFDITLSFDAS